MRGKIIAFFLLMRNISAFGWVILFYFCQQHTVSNYSILFFRKILIFGMVINWRTTIKLFFTLKQNIFPILIN